MSLGGFAEGPWAVDGDWEGFNHCTAENYYDAMLGEEWDLLGEGSFDMIENIVFWLCLNDPELGKGYNANAIYTGTFKTYKGRTFIDAIIDAQKVDYAEAYIQLGGKDFRLYILFMLYYKDVYNLNTVNYVYDGTILNAYRYDDRADLIKFFSNVFNELDRMYNELSDIKKKIEFLDIVRLNVKNFKSTEQISLNEVCRPEFARVLINKNKRGD